MKTKDIQTRLEQKALSEARITLDRAKAAFTSATKHPTDLTLSIRPYNDDGSTGKYQNITINVSSLLTSINDAIIKLRSDKIKADAITGFLTDFNGFKKYINDLEDELAINEEQS